ncbi:MAG: type II toxin-antitoxin system YoeB family toxin [Alistipes sp.]|nr:type II toxin-antitoxin system YoeB family toxin [Alistipes sp.]MCD7970492.1 type II toxin-antitoxin system YoeB family toxin [Alistipes sp.]
MKYKLIFSGQALADLEYHPRAGDTGILKKIVKLTSELEEHPATGTGQVEQLKYELSGKWSRRISQ